MKYTYHNKQIYFVVFFCLLNFTIINTSNSGKLKEEVCQRYEDESGSPLDDTANKAIGSNSQVKDAKKFIKGQVEGKTYLRDYVVDDKISEDQFYEELGKDIGIWVAFLILSILGYIIYLCGYYCDMCCKGAIICRKKSGEYSKCELTWPVIGINIFCVMVIVASGFGLYRASTFSEGYFLMKCELYGFFDDFNNQQEQDGKLWIGLNNLDKEMGTIQSDFVEEVRTTFSDQPWIETGYDSVSSAATQLDTNQEQQYNYGTVPPYTTDTDSNSKYFVNVFDPFAQIWLDFTNNGLSNLKQSLIDTQDFGMKLSEQSFQQGIMDGRKEISNMQDQIDDTVSDIQDSTQDVDDTYMDIVKQSIFIYFIVTLILAILSILTIILIAGKKMYRFRFILHITWCSFSIMMIVGFILCVVLWAVSMLGIQGCDIMERLLTDYEELKRVSNFNEDLLSKIRTCKEDYGGEGYILKDLGLDDQLGDIQSLNSNMKEANDNRQQSLTDIEELESKSEVQKQNLDSMELKVTFQDQSDQEQFEYAFSDNSYQDVCASGGFNLDTCQSNGRDLILLYQGNSQNGHCSNLNEYKNSQNKNEDWSNVPACVSGDNGLSSLIGWIEKKNFLVDAKRNDLLSMESSFNTYNQQIDDWFALIGDFSGSVNKILQRVENIVEKETNCLFIGTNIDRIYEALCVETIPNIFWISIIFIIHSLGMFFGAFFLYCAGFRYANIKTRSQQYQDDQQQQDENGYHKTNNIYN